MINKAIGSLFEDISEPVVTNFVSEEEIRAVSGLDESVYGGESINHEGLYAWWLAYKKGIYVLRKEGEVIGAIGIWPIKEITYRKLIEGKIDETDIGAEDISEPAAGVTHRYWYFADIVLEAKYHQTSERLALLLMEETLRQWLSDGSLAPRIHICALGFEGEGIKLLQRFNFQFAGGKPIKSPKGKPAYQRAITIEELQHELNCLSALRNRHSKPERGASYDYRSIDQHLQPPTEKEYDVFISYRREPAAQTALALECKLQNEKLRVFLDVSDLRAGRFDKALRDRIANTPNFIVILSPGCFDRCSDKKDWFRREITHALRKERNIIPIEMAAFEFPDPDALPSVLRSLNFDKYHRISSSHRLLDDVVRLIIEYVKR